MSKIIIHNNSKANDIVAIHVVKSVVSDGFVSGENQYCWTTAFSPLDLRVNAKPTRGTTHTFEVRDI